MPDLTPKHARVAKIALDGMLEYGCAGLDSIPTLIEYLTEELGEGCDIDITLARDVLAQIETGAQIELTDTQEAEAFLRSLDGMIESTEEFIADDGLRADDQRVHDLSALLRARELWETTFKPGAGA